MKSLTPFLREVLWVALILAALLFALTHSHQRGIERLEKQSAAFAGKPAAWLIESAWKEKDDLFSQKVIRSLTEAPGMVSARVVDRSGRALADADPAHIGTKPPARKASDVYRYTLSDGSASWGTLELRMVNRATSAFKNSQRWVSLLSVLLAGLALAWRGYRTSAVQSRLHARIADIEALEREARLEAETLRTERDRQSLSGRRLVTHLLEQLPNAAVLLDDHQRLAAVNASAGKILGLSGPMAFPGRSWQELPLLQGEGAALGTSLQQPGAVIAGGAAASGTTLEFVSIPDEGPRPAGTLVILRRGFGL